MAKQPTGYNSNFLGNTPSKSIFDPNYLNKYLSQAVLGNKNGFTSFFSDELNRPKIEQELEKKVKLENDNFQINSLRALTRNAYADLQVADKVAGDFFNRLNSASNKEELNSIYGELEDLTSKATTNTQLFGATKGLNTNTSKTPSPGLPSLGLKAINLLGSLGEVAGNLGDYATEIYAGLGRGDSPKLAQEKKLKSNKLSDDDFNLISRTYNPSELFTNIKGFIDKKHAGFNAISKVQNPEIFTQVQKAVANPSKQNAFDDIIKQKFLEATTTKGNNFYSGSLDKEEQQKFISKGLATLANPGSDLDNKYFKYDLENEALAEIQSGTIQLLQKEKSKPLKEQNKATIKELTSTLNSLETRRKEADKIYGVNKFSPWYEGSDRSGFWHAFGSAMAPIANLTRDNFTGALRTSAVYKPEVIKYDKNGNPVMTNQFAYEKADGSTGYNWGSALDIGGQVIGQILPTLATSSLVGGLTKGLTQTAWAANSAKAGIGLKTIGNIGKAAEFLGAKYDKLNKFKDLALADRLSTFATVSLTTMPSMIEQEKKWGGDYQYRGIVKALIEGTTEGVGFPDVGALRSIPFKSTIAADLKRVLGADMSVSERFLAFTHSAKAFGSIALKQNTVEALEEELSLLGNAMFEESLNENLGDRPKEAFNSENIQKTFVDSFVGGLLYSGLSTGMQARATLKDSNLKKLTNWDIANNPELYKAHLFDMHKKNKIDDKQLAQGMQKIVELQDVFEGMTSMSRIKDMKTLLDDKDEQFKYFTNTVKLNNLLKIDAENLTEEDKAILGKYKIENKINEKKINSVREAIAKLDQIAPEDLSEEQKVEKAQLTFDYKFLKQLNFKILNGEEVAKEDLDYLTNRGLIPNKNLQFTKEDLEKEINNISQELVKTKKRIDKYDNLTEQQKTEIITKAYDDKIEAIKKIKSLAELKASEKAVKDDLDYLKLKDKDYNKEDIANRERLYNAYADRAIELSSKGEDGYNEIEREFEQDGIYDNLLDQNDIFGLGELGRQATENKSVIEPDLYNSIVQNINNSFKEVIEKLTNSSEENLPQIKADALYNFLLKAASNYPGYLYDLDKVNDLFSWKDVSVGFTPQELIDARERVIETRAAINSKKVANQQSPYEEIEEEVIAEGEEEGLTDNELKEIKELSTETKQVVETLNQTSKEVDESGISPYKQLLQEYYEDKKSKFKTFAELSKIAFNLKNLIFPKNNSFTSSYQRLLNLHNDLFSTGNLEVFNAGIDQLIKENPNNTQLDSYKDFVNRLLVDFPIIPQTAVVETPTENLTSPKETITPAIVDGSIQEIEKQLSAQDVVRENRLLQLASPMRTMGVEAGKDDKFRNDPAVIRKVKQIDSLKTEEDDSKSALLINRKDFMLKFLKEVKNLTQEEANSVLDQLEDFFRNNTVGTPLPESFSEILGSEFFESNAIEYFLENNSKRFSVDPDVLITTVDKNNKLVVIEGYPIDLSVTSDKTKDSTSKIPWNISSRIIPALEKLGNSKEQAEQLILAEHAEAFKQFQEMKAAVKQGSQVSAPFQVSSGIMIKSKEMSREELQAAGNQEVDTLKLEDFKLITSSTDEAFGKTLQFEIGRLYVNVEGQPVLLSNKKFDPEEAAILVDYLFKDMEPEEFDSPEDFRKHLFNLINQVDRKNRLYFKENPDYGKVEGAPHTIVIKSSTDEKGVRTYTQLSKEELAKLLPEMYYKVSKVMMDSKKSIIRYFINEKGEIDAAKQSYLDYLKDVHTFPTQNNQLSKPVNKLVYFSPTLKPSSAPLTTIETKSTTPSAQPANDNTVVTPAVVETNTTTVAVNEVKQLMPNADKITSILTYEEAVEEHKKSSKFLPVSASVFPSKEDYETIVDGIFNKNFPIKAIGFIEDISYDLKSANDANEAITGLSIMLVSNPENPSQTFRIYLSLDTTKGSHIMGVKATELVSPETVIVSKEATTTPEDKFNAEEWAEKTFGEKEETTPVPTVQETSTIERRRQEDRDRPSRESVMYKLRNKIAGIDNPTPQNEIPTLSEAIKIAGAKISSPIKISEGEITHIVFDQEESTFRFTYKGKQFAAFYIQNARGNIRWEITKLNDKTGTYQVVSLDELKNINEKYGSQRDLLISLGAKDLVEDIENFEKVKYSQKDKSSNSGIIPLENTVSAEQVRLGKKYGVTYTLEDFLKQYDAELAALETPQETKAEKKPSVLQMLKQRETIPLDEETQKEAEETRKECKAGNTQDELSKVGQTKPLPKINRLKK